MVPTAISIGIGAMQQEPGFTRLSSISFYGGFMQATFNSDNSTLKAMNTRNQCTPDR